MTSADLLALAERVEAATGADAALDQEITAALAGATREEQSDGRAAYYRGSRWVSVGPIQPFTASLDAAMKLVPEGADAAGERFRLEHWNSNGVHAPHVRASAWVAGAARTYAATPALALTAAALRARAATEQGG